MRTRSRLVVGFVGAYLALSLAVGGVALTGVHLLLRAQAQASARAVGGVLAQRGFTVNDTILALMRRLTGYEFRVLASPEPPRPGTVQVQTEGNVVEIAYRTAEYERASRMVIVGSLVVVGAGAVVFALIGLWLAAQFARPLEAIAAGARAIGDGDLATPIPVAGSDEIRRLAATLEQMRLRIAALDRQHRQDERLATLGAFTATIAHEVRNPLTAVRLTAQMLARRLPHEGALPLVLEELERLDLIVDELLAYSKGMAVQPRPCALRPLVDDVLRLLRRQAEHAGVTIAASGDAVVLADPARLRQLVMNLVVNAIQAQHGGGVVTVDIVADGLAVADEGPGVDPALVPRLFEPFATGRPEGTGLGLHIAATIARAHGAELVHRPREPHGAVFALAGLRPAEDGTRG